MLSIVTSTQEAVDRLGGQLVGVTGVTRPDLCWQGEAPAAYRPAACCETHMHPSTVAPTTAPPSPVNPSLGPGSGRGAGACSAVAPEYNSRQWITAMTPPFLIDQVCVLEQPARPLQRAAVRGSHPWCTVRCVSSFVAAYLPTRTEDLAETGATAAASMTPPPPPLPEKLYTPVSGALPRMPCCRQRLDAIDLFVRRPGPSMEGRDGDGGRGTGLWSHDIAGHGTCDAAIAGQSGTGMRVFRLAADRPRQLLRSSIHAVPPLLQRLPRLSGQCASCPLMLNA
ncbi:unnamed protein product [Gadus morhua 'NCC']